jgi:hypothetical protein
MKTGFEMVSGGILYILSLTKIGSGARKLLGRLRIQARAHAYTHTHTQSKAIS